jgi:ribonuclease T1
MAAIRPLLPAARVALAALAALALCVVAAAPVAARTAPPTAEVAVAALPPEARDTLAAIRRGGPYAYDRDGIVFGNRERILPAEPRGHYHEYTVRTPGAKTRGARRIICGGPKQAPDACWYTDDHYQSFRRIRE